MPSSLFTRLLLRPRIGWTVAGCGLLFLLLIAAVAADVGIGPDSPGVRWRPLLVPAAIVTYIAAISRVIAGADATAMRALRPLTPLDDTAFARLVEQIARMPVAAELAVFAAGAVVGVVMSRTWNLPATARWLSIYVTAILALMFGLLAWTIYASVHATRVTAALHRQPLRVDLFDLRPFESIGRQSLMLALVFVGGLALSFLLGLDARNLRAWQTWVTNAPLAAVPILVFFLNMWPTHRLLEATRRRELAAVGPLVQHALTQAQQAVAAGRSPGAASPDLAALLAYQARVQAAPTWPYSTVMLRTVVVSGLLPLVVRAVSYLLFGS